MVVRWHRSSTSFRMTMLCMIALNVIVSAANTSGASLKPETVQAWKEYVRVADTRMQQRLSTDSAFLWIDEVPGGAALIRRRQIVVAPVGLLMPAKVPSGLVHDWIGAASFQTLQLTTSYRSSAITHTTGISTVPT